MEFSIAINVGMEIHSSQWGTTEYSRCFAYSSQFEVQFRCMISPMHSRTHLLILLLSHASTHLLTHSLTHPSSYLLTHSLAYPRISSSILLCIHSINQSHSYAPTHFLLHALCILYTSNFTNTTTNTTNNNTNNTTNNNTNNTTNNTTVYTTNNTTNNTHTTTGWDYDRVMRNNFTPEDLCAIADIVSMIKRLGTPHDTLEPCIPVSLHPCISSKLYTTQHHKKVVPTLLCFFCAFRPTNLNRHSLSDTLFNTTSILHSYVRVPSIVRDYSYTLTQLRTPIFHIHIQARLYNA